MSKAQTDIRATSYDANQANAVGYQGTLDDALAQVRAERDFPVTNRGRAELIYFLGADKDIRTLSGEQENNDLLVYLRRANLFMKPADDSVTYYSGNDDTIGEQPNVSIYSLEYAMQRWPENFQ
jgi:hypothetical protein